jgi:hypothetical protein
LPSLSEAQLAAVEYLDGPALICSGAGAGKTSTIVAKFEHLIEAGYDPKRVLCITFTNKAANELKDRLKIDWTRDEGFPVGEDLSFLDVADPESACGGHWI